VKDDTGQVIRKADLERVFTMDDRASRRTRLALGPVVRRLAEEGRRREAKNGEGEAEGRNPKSQVTSLITRMSCISSNMADHRRRLAQGRGRRAMLRGANSGRGSSPGRTSISICTPRTAGDLSMTNEALVVGAVGTRRVTCCGTGAI